MFLAYLGFPNHDQSLPDDVITATDEAGPAASLIKLQLHADCVG